ncbi:hypothetical protein BOTCAL_0434g00080 [Botryotinia calthae]|uniref:Uncharacterized protein n=1 Tax=Botryotinia calthae TaxID=38488 RepID=A0A4Y8CNT2_9HELO|nr:hypothetical protein BOTCAL_0434g00080 [Botryotinia calthae]
MSPPSTPISSSPRSSPSPPSAPHPNRFRDAIQPSFETEQNIREFNDRYRSGIIILVAQDFEKKTGSKLNVKKNSKTAVSTNSQTPVSVPPAASKTKSQREKSTADRRQIVYGSAEWHAANDGFVEMSEAEKEAEKRFWS